MDRDAREIRVGGLTVLAEERRAFFGDAELNLTAREFDVLARLAERPGWVFSSDQLSDDDDIDSYASPFAVNVHVSHLRRKLTDVGAQADLIETVRGSGWRMKHLPVQGRGAAAPSLATFVGRETELDTLKSVASNCAGRIVVVLGEPGIGKTSLVEKALEELSPRFSLFRVVCDGNGSGDHWMWRQLIGDVERRSGVRVIDQLDGALLTRIFGDAVGSPSASPEGSDRALAYDAAGRYLETALGSLSRPAIAFVDDLQWADDASLKLLSFLSLRMAEIPVLLIACCRSSDARRRPPLRGVVEYASQRRDAALIALEGLPHPEVTELVRIELEAAEAEKIASDLWERTQGNPLFLRECLRALRASGGTAAAIDRVAASSVSGLVQRQVAELAPSVRELLLVAAVSGAEFDPELVVVAAGVTEKPAWIDEALDSGLVVATAGGARFRHALVRDALLEGLAPSEAQELQGKVARAMRGLPMDRDTRVFRLAHHYARAKSADRPDAIGFLIAAARVSSARMAFEDTIVQLTEALQLLSSLQLDIECVARTRSAILERRGAAHSSLHRWETARDDYSEAIRARPAGDLLAHARLNTRLGVACTWGRKRGDCSQAFATALGALDRVAERGGAWWRAWIEVRVQQVDAAYITGLPCDVVDVRAELETAVERYGTLEQRAKYYNALASEEYMQHRFVVTDDCLDAARAALKYADRSGSRYLRSVAVGILGSYLVQHGEFVEGEVRLREATDLCQRCEDFIGQQAALWFLSIGARLSGDVRRTETIVRELEQLTKEKVSLPEFTSGFKGQLAWVALRRGDLEGAARLSDEALAEWEVDPSCSQAVWIMAWPAISCALAKGDLERAVECAGLMIRSDQQALSDSLDSRGGEAVRLFREGKPEAAEALMRVLEAEALAFGYA